jgi:hypothetical protein
MKRIRLSLIAAACGAALAGTALAQTTGTTTTTTTTTAAGTTTTTSTSANAAYLKRAEARFGVFAGSNANVDSLASGLRSGTEITLVDGSGTVKFTPPTKPMGYGNVTRSLDLAQRQLAAAGITDPTPQQIQIALMGGTIAGPNGDVKFAGVLQLRSEGMGWGQIAHTINVHPGMGKSSKVSAPTSGATSSALGTTSSQRGMVTAAGGSSVANGNGRGVGASAHATTSAAGASSGAGVSSAKGQGNAFGRADK